jgi:hypothetical protein
VPVHDGCRAPHAALRPVRQGKKSGPAGGVQGRSVRGRVGLPAGRAGKEVLAVGSSLPAQAGMARKVERAGTGGLERSRPGSETSYPGQYDKESRTAGPVQDDCRADRYRRDSCTMHIHHNQLITSQQTTSEAAKAIFIQGFISSDVLKHARLLNNTGYTPYD